MTWEAFLRMLCKAVDAACSCGMAGTCDACAVWTRVLALAARAAS